MAGSTPPSDAELVASLRTVQHALRRHTLAALEPYGLSPHQARAFLVLSRADADGQPLRLTDLAQRLRIAPRSATEVVDALERGGLVQRRPSPTDRRAHVVVVTAQGRTVARQVRARQERQPLLAALSAPERRQLGAILERLVQAAEQDTTPAR